MNEQLINSFVEIQIVNEDDFLKVRETLTRIGIASPKNKKLFQSCHILHKRGKYYITHFKELFALDGKEADFTDNDIQRRNTIAKLLQEWGLLKMIDSDSLEYASMNQIKIISHKDKKDWNLVPKYNIGKKR